MKQAQTAPPDLTLKPARRYLKCHATGHSFTTKKGGGEISGLLRLTRRRHRFTDLNSSESSLGIFVSGAPEQS